MHPRIRKLVLILTVIGIILLVVIGVPFLLIGLALKSGIPMVPQDCQGTSIHLSGIVRGVSGAEVAVTAGDFLQGDKGTVHFNWITDANGKFDSGNESIPVFVCEMLDVQVAAKGFETKKITYSFFDHFSEDELGASMEKGHTLPVVLDIELERSK